MHPEFLQMLRCPTSRQPLRPAAPAELAALNAAIRQGQVRNRGGQKVADELVAGLVCQDGSALYPIVQDIPILLSTEAIPLDVSADAAGRPASRAK